MHSDKQMSACLGLGQRTGQMERGKRNLLGMVTMFYIFIIVVVS